MNPSFKTTTKNTNPAISIKTEFNTGLTDNLNDNTDQPEILKHTNAVANVPIPQTSNMLPISPLRTGILASDIFSIIWGLSTFQHTSPYASWIGEYSSKIFIV